MKVPGAPRAVCFRRLRSSTMSRHGTGCLSMFLSNFFRPRDSLAVSVGNKPHTFKGGTIVAQAEWEPQQRDGSRMAVGYTSYRGDLVPVYDLAAKLGFGSCRSPLIVIVATEAGYVAFIVNELVKYDERSTTTIDLDDLFGGLKRAA
ncbi:chemotaxis protein CheW (plasmid) [Rhizobium leguminosarum]|nr:chemotaxis protein CheW [Rhizobium leguminosarum]TAU79266.1 chemotaxis protein CheW [Rhizobium leguminosarum]TAV40773.1 chemotaxis protein CheW [Rhizobium leguminosarum]TAV41718.1 chemotaxis protein CheW [Rhizobium leguminosarum]TAV42185.1 chemotaxis protein CheW [Rhizobium leguminosarum]